MTLRIKGSGHQPLTAQLQKDWQQMFLVHPNAFDGLLYVPIEDDSILNPDVDTPLFGQLNDHQEREAYADPVPVSIIEVKGDDSYGLVSGEDGTPLGLGESEIFKCRLSSLIVPDGSVVSYKELVGTSALVRWWYVHRSVQVPYSHIDAAKIYSCIPFGDLELEAALIAGGAL